MHLLEKRFQIFHTGEQAENEARYLELVEEEARKREEAIAVERAERQAERAKLEQAIAAERAERAKLEQAIAAERAERVKDRAKLEQAIAGEQAERDEAIDRNNRTFVEPRLVETIRTFTKM